MISQAYFDKVKAEFNGDDAKTWVWWQTPNPMFGMFSPLNMLKLGKEKRVMQCIDNALSGYLP